MDALTEEHVWGGYEEEHAKYVKGSPHRVKHIDGDFFDNHLVSRWTSGWLGGDVTWVIGFGKNVPWNEDYMFSLSPRTVTILNDHFYKGDEKVRFGIIDYSKWEDIKETLGVYGPTVLVLKDGVAYMNSPMKETYHLVHEFLESKIPDGDIYSKKEVSGRITLPGLYLTYWKREVRQA